MACSVLHFSAVSLTILRWLALGCTGLYKVLHRLALPCTVCPEPCCTVADVPSCTVLAVLYLSALFFTVLCYLMVCCTVLHCLALSWKVLYCLSSWTPCTVPTEYTQSAWQWPISGVHSIIMENQPWPEFFWDSHWLEIWSNHFCPSMGLNGGSVATDSGVHCTPTPYHVQSCSVLSTWKGRYTHLPICTLCSCPFSYLQTYRQQFTLLSLL